MVCMKRRSQVKHLRNPLRLWCLEFLKNPVNELLPIDIRNSVKQSFGNNNSIKVQNYYEHNASTTLIVSYIKENGGSDNFKER